MNIIMACDAPISIRFKTPIKLTTGELQYYFPADCGKCLKCLQKRKAQWSYRMTEEKRVSFSAYFVTLTYDDKNLPMTDEGCTINKNDHFDFISKLKELEKPKNLALRSVISQEELDRKEFGIKEIGKLKYYGISEYGDEKGRSHWHYILFNVRDSNNIALAWSSALLRDDLGRVIDFISRGRVQIDPDVNVRNIDYVLKYMVKFKEDGKFENKAKEVSFMSKGLGLSVADRSFIDHIKMEDQNQVLNSRGNKIPLPRYYRKKFLTEDICIAKNTYVANEILNQKNRQENSLISRGQNPDKIEQLQKETRVHILKSRTKRNYE